MLETRLTRRGFLNTATAAGFLAASHAAQPAPRPNILWIIAEDFCPDLGCYGNTLVHTPHIDRLASEGVRFTNAFMTAPVCSAARSALATGMFQTSIGAHHHRSHRNDGYRLPVGVHLFTHYFRQAGYHTSNVTSAAPGVRGTGKTDFNFQLENAFDGEDWKQRRPGQPFYAQVNFSETHRAFRRSRQRPIDRARIVLPPYYPDHPAVREDWGMYLETAQNLDLKVGKLLDRLRGEGLLETTIVFFFGDNGQPMPRAKQFLYDGGIHIPLIVRIPAAFRPEDFRPGATRSDLVSSIDITATSLKLAGITPPAHMQGQVMIGPGARTRDHIAAARDRCDETVDRIRCVRTARFKYIRNYYPERPYTQPNNYKDTSYPTLRVMRDLHRQGRLKPEQARFMASERPPEELYDLEADPHELRNLAGSKAHANTLEHMRGTLREWIAETRDQGEKPESPMPVEEYQFRTQVDGWCTSGSSRASKNSGTLRVECSGQSNILARSCVTEPGPLRLEFRARGREAAPRTLFWAPIDEMANGPRPGRQVPVEFVQDGQWHDYSLAFQTSGFLGLIGLDFGEGNGIVEFEWIRLSSGAAGSAQPIEQWDFS